VRIALPGFLVPYMTVADPALMMQPVAGLEGLSYWLTVAYVVGKAVLAIGLWGIAAFGYLNGKVSWPGRLLAVGTAALLIFPTITTDIIGLALTAAFAGWRFVAARRATQS
jgi:TRAP-type uncharacterized transport system fused permease subunit